MAYTERKEAPFRKRGSFHRKKDHRHLRYSSEGADHYDQESPSSGSYALFRALSLKAAEMRGKPSSLKKREEGFLRETAFL